VITSSVEHNALMRPLVSMTEQGVEFTRVQCDEEGNIDPDMVEGAIQSNTKVIFMTHASNVCGTILNLEAIGEIAEKHNLFFIIDAAQTAGYMPVDMKKLKANAIAFTGHKSLLGPQGIGGFIIDDKLNDVVSPFIEGGTGSASDKEVQPNRLPDKFESGTPNLPGIFGLNASLKYILGRGIEGIRNHEDALVDRFIQGIKGIEGLRLVGKMSSAGRTPVISVDFIHDDNGFEAFELDRNYNISVRVGMHCAPSAHKTLGTYPQGTVRFSLGYANTEEEVDYVIDAIKALMREKGVN